MWFPAVYILTCTLSLEGAIRLLGGELASGLVCVGLAAAGWWTLGVQHTDGHRR